MNIYILKEKDYNLLDLPNSPFKLEQIPVGAKEMYLKIYSLYMKFFTEYIIRNTDLKKYDDLLYQNRNLIDFIKDDDKDPYQLLSNNMLKYFYVRNNLYLYRLDNKELQVLLNKIQSQDFSYDDNVEKFITKTFKKVILETEENNKNLLTCFGPENTKFYVDNGTIVIGVRFEETLNFEEYFKQKSILNKNLNKVQEDLLLKLNSNVIIINYDRTSIKIK